MTISLDDEAWPAAAADLDALRERLERARRSWGGLGRQGARRG
jgi:hypothetical protein